MVEYFRDRNEATSIFGEENKKIYNVITCAADFINLDHNKTRTLLDNNELITFAQEHGEMNMIQLFKHFNYPIPETEEQKKDPRFCLHLLYKRDSNGKLIPRENIYYYEKNIKGYKNPLKSSYTILDDGTKIDNSYIKPLNKKENFDGMQKSKILDKTIYNLRNNLHNKNELNDNTNNKKLLQYNLCIKYYSNQLGLRDLKTIGIEEIASLGQIYYLIKRANEEKEDSINPFNNYEINKNKNIFFEDDDEDENNIFSGNYANFGIINMKNKKKEEPKITFIDKLVKNTKITETNFGYLSIKPGESQIIFKDISDIKFDSNNENNNNISKDTDSQLLTNVLNKLVLTTQKKNEKDSIDNTIIFMDNNFPKRNNESQYGYYGNSILYDDYRLVLILKGKRIDYKDWEGKKDINKYYFKFYVENKLLNTVEVIFNSNVAKEDMIKFKKVMNKVKINEQIIIVFAYNPIFYFNVRYLNYDFPPSGVESVFYIDSSKENPNVKKIFEEINK